MSILWIADNPNGDAVEFTADIAQKGKTVPISVEGNKQEAKMTVAYHAAFAGDHGSDDFSLLSELRLWNKCMVRLLYKGKPISDWKEVQRMEWREAFLP